MIKRINLRFCIIHFLAAYCLCYSFFYLALIPYESVINCIEQGGKDTKYWEGCVSLEDISYFLIITNVMKLLGILTSLLISGFLSFKRRISWINSFLVFTSMYLLYYFDILGWQYARYIVAPLWLLDNFMVEKAMAALLLIALSMFLWFSPITNRFMAKATT
ncbi:hypothetical protein AM493_07495 [Flavobacterium akiainvivens]|uniref:Uncharacterized protein n=1 Tax=Flavobacterium akiainvivens TaxID=1202724 RepID=A0A0M8MHI3_9FLAO|nr:hypothetical protein AM493_07495 [Flavobacterium akiainvivens]SFQ56117.1 hypothetical protein SAMN05444144_10819 [Flavobacterium akiainvivens]